MKAFGFSTGALARDNVELAIAILEKHYTQAVEYSALRLSELEPLVKFLVRRGIGTYQYAAFHAPSSFEAHEEEYVVRILRSLVDKVAINIVVHPDVIYNYELWQPFGNRLCVENMDHRKSIGRTADELDPVFEKLPHALLCFDIGHAHEVDRSMSLAYGIAKRFHNKIAHIHASEVSDQCRHHAFSASSHSAFLKLADIFATSIPVILEMEVSENRVEAQLHEAMEIFERRPVIQEAFPVCATLRL